jgi:hypothetical protein
MRTSFSVSDSESFTVAHAKRIASKVATDLLRFQTLYGSPTTQWIDDYERELVEMLKRDVVGYVEYGFKRDGKWTEAAVRYKALPGGTLVTDDDPGKIRPRLNVAGAPFTSFMSCNSNRWSKTQAERDAIKQSCPFQRTSGSAPALEAGNWTDDLNYVAGGRGLGRATVRR